MEKLSIFKKNPEHAQALLALTPRQRAAFVASGIGAIVPALLVIFVRPVYWLAALQFACLAVLAYIRWRVPGFQGSLVVFILAVIACIVSVVAGVAA